MNIIVFGVLAWAASSFVFVFTGGWFVTMMRRRDYRRSGEMPGLRMPAGRPWPGAAPGDERLCRDSHGETEDT